MKRHVTVLACLVLCTPGLFPAQLGISQAFATSNGNGNHNGNGNTGDGNGNHNGNGNAGDDNGNHNGNGNAGDDNGNHNGNGSSVTSSDPGNPPAGSGNTATAALSLRAAPTQSYTVCAKGHRVEAGLGNGCF